MCPLELRKVFSLISPSDLYLNTTCPSFIFDVDIMMNNIQTKFHVLWIIIVPSKVYTWFSII